MMSTLGLTVTTVGNAIQYSNFHIPSSVNLPVTSGSADERWLGNADVHMPLQTLSHGKLGFVSS